MRKQKAKIIAIASNLAVVLFIMALGAGSTGHTRADCGGNVLG